MWVLTREENDYDQYGHYFVAVFKQYPSPEQLQDVIGPTDDVSGKSALC